MTQGRSLLTIPKADKILKMKEFPGPPGNILFVAYCFHGPIPHMVPNGLKERNCLHNSSLLRQHNCTKESFRSQKTEAGLGTAPSDSPLWGSLSSFVSTSQQVWHFGLHDTFTKTSHQESHSQRVCYEIKTALQNCYLDSVSNSFVWFFSCLPFSSITTNILRVPDPCFFDCRSIC